MTMHNSNVFRTFESDQYVWDVGMLVWVPMTQPGGGGGGGGAVTVADGADVTQGAIADAAVQGDNPGTISAKLRGLNKSIAAGIPITTAAPLAVTGPLTDAELRAVAVPVSAASLPLPTGAATEATLATRLADATFTGRINTQGQKAMAASTPVVVASDQSALPISAAALPLPANAAMETGGNLDNIAANTGNTITSLDDIGSQIAAGTGWRVNAPASSTTWTSATLPGAQNQIDNSALGRGTVVFQITVTGSITAGTIDFESSMDNGVTWQQVPRVFLMFNGSAQAPQLTNTLNLAVGGGAPYTVWTNAYGYTQIRARLATALVGAGSVVVLAVSSANPAGPGMPNPVNLFAKNLDGDGLNSLTSTENPGQGKGLLVGLMDPSTGVYAQVVADGVTPVFASDPALSVAHRGPLPAGSNTIGAVTVSSGTVSLDDAGEVSEVPPRYLNGVTAPLSFDLNGNLRAALMTPNLQGTLEAILGELKEIRRESAWSRGV